MNNSRGLVWRGILLVVLLLAGCQRTVAPTDVELDGSEYHIRGPFSHDNVTVFLLSSDRQDERDFLTLDEGLKDGRVEIAEQEEERVGALRIENRSDRPLYLQEGERLQGGKQDRIIITSLVVPPRSGKTSVPTLCVEQSRWVEGDKGREFGFTVNPALAPKGVRGAAKIEGSQDRVWICVQVQKGSAATQLQAKNTNSSVNEMLDAPQVRAIAEVYAKALGSALDGPEGRDVVGVAIVVNGQIEEVDIYPNRALFGKLYPRLIQSYALQATLLKDQPTAPVAVSASAVARFLGGSGKSSEREKSLDAHNVVRIGELEDDKYRCTTRYDGQLVHWQMMKKNGKGGTERQGILGSNW